MGKVPRRKRVKHRKRHKEGLVTSKESCSENSSLTQELPSTDLVHDGSSQTNTFKSPVLESTEASDSSIVNTLQFHNYAKAPDDSVSLLTSQSEKPLSDENVEISVDVLNEVKTKLEAFLYPRWMCIIRENAIHVVLTASHTSLTIQRDVVFLPCGSVELYVHCHSIPVDPYLTKVYPPLPLRKDSVDYFVDRSVGVVNLVRRMDICSGIDDEKLRHAWETCNLGEVDMNIFKECRFAETYRSLNCERLVHPRSWRCAQCSKLYGPLRRKAKSNATPQPALHAANKFMSEQQKMNKLEDQRKKLSNANKKIARLHAKVQELIHREGVKIDNVVADDLSQILKDSAMTPAQSVFLQQQVKASQCKNKSGMRWHPTMIRLALSIYLTSPSAYETVRDTGMIKLPCSRTLFEYLHVKQVEEGVDGLIMESLAERVGKLAENYQKKHVLMADEMHISQNLIYQKSTGRLVGYTSLDDIDQEVRQLENYLDNPSKEVEPLVATKVMTYMVKGVSSGIKEVVATYGVSNLSVNQMYMWTWEVIGALERIGVHVVAFVCDGCSVNRAFIKKHIPITKLANGLVFDTLNKAAGDRVLYFISDVPHLLKTIRNCLLNSRFDKKKGRRRMSRNSKKISWDFIIRLYEGKKGKNLRKAFKLTPMNVYPDSYSRMKVKYAAEVLSLTVAQALEDEKWDEAGETIKFLRWVNNWFDCLNGAHSSMGRRRRNVNLEPYTSADDSRFAFLLSFLEYLNTWKEDANLMDHSKNTTLADGVQDKSINDLEESAFNVDEEDDDAVEETPASKRILSRQTMEGIEISTRAFIEVVKYLISCGTKFVNARVFTQDPLEQHFSKVRAGQGGSTNPNLGQVLNRNRAIHTIGQLGMKRKRGNTTEVASTVEVTTEPLARRKRSRVSKFSGTD